MPSALSTPPPLPAIWIAWARFITNDEILDDLNKVEPEQVQIQVKPELGVDTRVPFVTRRETKRFK